MNFINQKWFKECQRTLLMGAGLWIASQTSTGIVWENYWVLAAVTLVLACFNLVLKPLFIFLTLPFVVLTMGLGLWIINALLLMLAAHLVPGFTVTAFLSALLGAFVMSFISVAIPFLFRKRERPTITIQPQIASVEQSLVERYKKDDRAIDI